MLCGVLRGVQATVCAYNVLILLGQPYVRKGGITASRSLLGAAHDGLLLLLTRNACAGDDRLHQVVQVELLLVMLSGSILYLDRELRRDASTDAALSALLILVTVAGICVFVHIAAVNLLKLFKKKRRTTIKVRGCAASCVAFRLLAHPALSLSVCSLLLACCSALQSEMLAHELSELKRVHSKNNMVVEVWTALSLLSVLCFMGSPARAE